MKWLNCLWAWLTEGPAIKPEPPRGYPPVIVDCPEESAESAAMPSAPYSVRVDEHTADEEMPEISTPIVEMQPFGPWPKKAESSSAPQKIAHPTRKRRTRKHK